MKFSINAEIYFNKVILRQKVTFGGNYPVRKKMYFESKLFILTVID